MSAHCNDCGADLVYGKGENWQVMTCPVCTLRVALIFWVGRARRFEEKLEQFAYMKARGVTSDEYELGRRIFEESLPSVDEVEGIFRDA